MAGQAKRGESPTCVCGAAAMYDALVDARAALAASAPVGGIETIYPPGWVSGGVNTSAPAPAPAWRAVARKVRQTCLKGAGWDRRADAVAAALAAAVAGERERCARLVERATLVYQTEPPLAVTSERLEGLRQQIAAALREGREW
jgi:hypothetical protein